MPLLTMALITGINGAGDVIHSRNFSHLYWLTDAVLSFATFAHLAHYASSFCYFLAHPYATSLGEDWPPFAAGIGVTGDVTHPRITSHLDWPDDAVLFL